MNQAPARKRHLTLVHSRSIPLTRGECVDGPRPCPHVRCSWSLGPDVPCVLDRADEGGLGQYEVAKILGVTYQRIDQIERDAIRKIAKNPKHRRILKVFAEP